MARCAVCHVEQAALLLPLSVCRGLRCRLVNSLSYSSTNKTTSNISGSVYSLPRWLSGCHSQYRLVTSQSPSPAGPLCSLSDTGEVGSFLCVLGFLQSCVTLKGCTAVVMGSTSPLGHGLGFLSLSSQASHSTFYSRSEFGF